MTTASDITTAPTVSLLDALRSGRPDWEALLHFPEPDPADQERDDTVVRELGTFLDAHSDPDDIDLTLRLPDGLLDGLHAAGAFKLSLGADLGGPALSPRGVFRAVEAAAARSLPVGFMLGVHNGIGVGASLLPVLPPGPLRELIRSRAADGMVSGFADTEPAGGGNQWPTVTATPTADGTGYVLHGEKLFVSNGPVADLLGVTATIRRAGERQVGLFVVDTRAPGFEVAAQHEYIGGKGVPNSRLRFDGLVVPKEHTLTLPDGGDPRHRPDLVAAVANARMLIQGAPALAIARNCLRWSREFAGRRRIDGRELASYDLIQRMLAATAADVHAMDSVVRWCLDCPDPGARVFEQILARNICTDAATRVVDRTISLFGGEGLETVRSKRARGAVPVPLERAYRDVRILRTAGGVDFLVHLRAARLLFASSGVPAGERGPGPSPYPTHTDGLSPRNRTHLYAVHRALHRLAVTGAGLMTGAAPTERQDAFVQLGRIAAELLTMTAVLARTTSADTVAAGTATARADQDQALQHLADVHCTAALHRVHTRWHLLHDHPGPDHAAASRTALSGAVADRLTRH